MSSKFKQQSATGRLMRTPRGETFVVGTTVPTDGTAGYAPGCFFIKQDGTAGAQVYINEGTLASSDFNAMGTPTNFSVPTGQTLAVTDADKLTVGGKIVPQVLELAFAIQPNATVTEYDIWVAPAAYQVTSIKYVPSTLQGGAMTATVVKVTGTSAPDKATTPMVTADVINLNSNAYTVVTPTLTATVADLQLAAGNRIGIDYSAAPTAAFWALAITLKRI